MVCTPLPGSARIGGLAPPPAPLIAPTFVLALVLALVLSACGSDDPTGPGEGASGTFQATLSGDVTASLTGGAMFTTVPGEAFVLNFSTGDASGSMGIELEELGRPGTGTIQLGSSTSGAYGYGVVGNTLFFSESGSVTITSSSSTALVGTFQFEAQTPTADEITVTGTFSAQCVAGCG